MESGMGRIRAAMPQFLLGQVEAFEPDRRDSILRPVSAQALQAIRARLPIGWVEMSHHMEFVEQLAGVVGPQEYVSLWESCGRNFVERPILGGLLGMAKRLFLKEPREAIRYLPRMYGIGVEGLGEVTVDDLSDQTFSIQLRGFPASQWNFENFTLGVAGATKGACAVMFPSWPLELGFNEPDFEAGAVDLQLSAYAG